MIISKKEAEKLLILESKNRLVYQSIEGEFHNLLLGSTYDQLGEFFIYLSTNLPEDKELQTLFLEETKVNIRLERKLYKSKEEREELISSLSDLSMKTSIRKSILSGDNIYPCC